MEYRKFGSTYILRIDRGEEILASITTLCNAERSGWAASAASVPSAR